MRIKNIMAAAAGLVHEGQTHEPDEHGFFELPFELAQSLLRFPFWEAAEPAVVVPEPEAVPDVDEAKEPELTPAEKGALTKAANAAAAAEAEAKAAAEAAAEAAKPKI